MLLNGTIFIGIWGHDPNSKDKDELRNRESGDTIPIKR